jgi:hypothetical protein
MIRERKTVEAMIGLYCKKQHEPEGTLCAECQELLRYAFERLDNCPFQERKTTCARCPVHCYRPELRERIRAVMRYAGPRMLFNHPLLAIQHLWDRQRSNSRLDRLQ